MNKKCISLCILLLHFFFLGSCMAPKFQKVSGSTVNPILHNDHFIAHDGIRLPLRVWSPEKADRPRAIIIALHGFNDYSNFFHAPGSYFAKKNIISYAYDQRGFGNTVNRGIWPGVSMLIKDVISLCNLVRSRHPGIPLFLFGESMGGGIAMVALKKNREHTRKLNLDGVILAAPAVWGRETMPWYQNAALWVSAHTFPYAKLSGRGLKITASDNLEMLRDLSRDPLVIKKTRIDTLYGLTNLMDQALNSASSLNEPLLLLYGEKDEIIPKKPTMLMISRLPQVTQKKRKVILYKRGYHMLLRDLQSQVVWQDIDAWIEDHQ